MTTDRATGQSEPEVEVEPGDLGALRARSRSRRAEREAKPPSLRDRVEVWAFRGAARVVRLLPLAPLQWLAGRIASAVFRRRGKRVQWTLTNLRIAFPDKTEDERCEIGRQSYVHFSWNLIDYLRADSWTEAELAERVTFHGLEHLRAARAEGRGVVMMTLHMGNFELGSSALALQGMPVASVGRKLRNRLLWTHIVERRTRTGAVVIERSGAARGMLKALRSNSILGVLNDQYSRRTRGVFVPLFGVRCSTTAGVATIALRTGSPIVPSYVIRVGPDRHEAFFGPPLEIPTTGDVKTDIETATAHYNRALEAMIRRHPEQWMWGHRRFRHSPDLDGDPYTRAGVPGVATKA